MRFAMNKLLSCRYNMDTKRMAPLLPSTASPWRTSTAAPPHSGQSWTGCCATGRWSTHSLCWEERWSTISRWDATTAGWKIDFLKSRCHLSTNRIYYK